MQTVKTSSLNLLVSANPLHSAGIKSHLFFDKNKKKVLQGDTVGFYNADNLYVCGYVSNLAGKGLKIHCFNEALQKWQYYSVKAEESEFIGMADVDGEEFAHYKNVQF